jgi:hypothetical protein
MFDVKEMKEVRRVGMPSHVAAVQWHPKINQIFVGIGEWLRVQHVSVGVGMALCCRVVVEQCLFCVSR